MELVGTFIMVCIAIVLLLSGYAGARVVLRRYKRGENILATPEAEKELLFTLLCTTLGVMTVCGLAS